MPHGSTQHTLFTCEHALTHPTPPQVLIVQGFMTKQGGMHKNWKKRWFCNSFEDPFTLSFARASRTLSLTTITTHTRTHRTGAGRYYTDETLKTLKGTIDLREVYHFRTKYDTTERGPKQRVGIALVTPSRTWKLIAVGSTNGDYWTQGLERLIHIARNGNGSGSGSTAASTGASAAAVAPSAPTEGEAAPQRSSSTRAKTPAAGEGEGDGKDAAEAAHAERSKSTTFVACCACT